MDLSRTDSEIDEIRSFMLWHYLCTDILQGNPVLPCPMCFRISKHTLLLCIITNTRLLNADDRLKHRDIFLTLRGPFNYHTVRHYHIRIQWLSRAKCSINWLLLLKFKFWSMQIHRYIICYIYYNMSVGCTTLLSDCNITIVAYMFKLQPITGQLPDISRVRDFASDMLAYMSSLLFLFRPMRYYAALLRRRGPHIASHSVCLSVRPSRYRCHW